MQLVLETILDVSKLRAYRLSNKVKQLTNAYLPYESSEMFLLGLAGARKCFRVKGSELALARHSSEMP